MKSSMKYNNFRIKKPPAFVFFDFSQHALQEAHDYEYYPLLYRIYQYNGKCHYSLFFFYFGMI